MATDISVLISDISSGPDHHQWVKTHDIRWNSIFDSSTTNHVMMPYGSISTVWEGTYILKPPNLVNYTPNQHPVHFLSEGTVPGSIGQPSKDVRITSPSRCVFPKGIWTVQFQHCQWCFLSSCRRFFGGRILGYLKIGKCHGKMIENHGQITEKWFKLMEH